MLLDAPICKYGMKRRFSQFPYSPASIIGGSLIPRGGNAGAKSNGIVYNVIVINIDIQHQKKITFSISCHGPIVNRMHVIDRVVCACFS
jgi:hypothetical protein